MPCKAWRAGLLKIDFTLEGFLNFLLAQGGSKFRNGVKMNKIKTTNFLLIILIILIIIIGIIYYFKVVDNSSNPANKADKKLSEVKTATITTKDYLNDSHKLTIKYPENWYQKDLGGDKNITKPLTMENIIMFFDAEEGTDPESNSPSASASVKINRFVLEASKSINSQDDWYSYIEEKVNVAKESDIAKENGYQYISLTKHDDINGKWAIEEKYRENDEMMGKDIYLFNNGNGEFYQLVCRSKEVVFGDYQKYFDTIIDSFKIGQ